VDVDDSLVELERMTGASFSGLLDARSHSKKVLESLRAECASLSLPDECSIVAEGSLGRSEMTSGSDLDFLVLTRDDSGRVSPDLEAEFRKVIERIGLTMPTQGGPFGPEPVHLSDLKTKIGGDPDLNTTVTHRMLLLLESTPIAGDGFWRRAREELLEVYLEKSTLKDHRPPRFLLNDLIRYWRTLCVDYEGKLRQAEGQKWAIRNAKLRTVRKMLFAGGLFPLLECTEKGADEISPFLSERFKLPPADRIALFALRFDSSQAGAQALSAYSEMLTCLDDPQWRSNLETLSFESRGESAEQRKVKEIGSRFQDGLEALLFNERLAKTTQRYLVF
jgi:Nucleotidyltransferase domain